MNNPPELAKAEKKAARREAERKALPFFIEFVKFSALFAIIIAIAFLTLSLTSFAAG